MTRQSVGVGLRWLRSVLELLARRAAFNRGLAIATASGIAIAVALLVSIPIYSEAVLTAQLRRELATSSRGTTVILRQNGSRSGGGVQTALYQQADEFVRTRAARVVGAQLRTGVRLGQSELVPIVLDAPDQQPQSRDYASYGFFLFLSDFERHVDVQEGRLPAGRSNDGAIEAALATAGIDELGVHVGDTIQLLVPAQGGSQRVPVRIVGRWDARDPESPYWLDRPDAYNLALVVSEQSYFEDLLATYPRASREFAWSLLLDQDSLRAGDAGALLSGLQALRAAAPQAARGLRVDLAPDDLLESYARRAYFLSTLLLALAAPILVIVLQFTGLVAGLLVDRQRGEIAVLRSRGATVRHVVGIYLIEGLAAASVIVVAAPLLGMLLATLIGQTTGFLRFAPVGLLPVQPDLGSLLFGVAAAGLGIAATVLPAAGAARHSIVTYKRDVVRTFGTSRWRRYGIDLVALPIAGYSYYLLRVRQTVLPTSAEGEVFSDPLLVVAPAIFILAGGLVGLRIFPLALNLAERLLRFRASPPLLLALRQLARRPSTMNGVVLLLALTTALGIFSAAMAATIDRADADSLAYRVGSDLRVSESGAYDNQSGEWTLLPVGEHLNVPGVVGAARVYRGTATENLSSRAQQLDLLAIDSYEMLDVAYWRPDYGGPTLADVLIPLIEDPTGLVLDRRLLDQYRLSVGDQLTLTVRDQLIDFTVVGAVDLFPTLYPNERRFVIANLDYVFERSGPQPFDVWLRLADGAEPEEVVASLQEYGFHVTRSEALRPLLVQRRADPTRLGVLGLLTVGFVIAALLSVLALALQAYLGFRRRALQLGILRALGFRQSDVTKLFISEQVIGLATGIGAGTAIGLVTTLLFVPFLQVRIERNAGTPPVLAVFPWVDIGLLYFVLAILIVPVVPLVLRRLLHFRMHEAIKFGEEAV